MRKSILYPLWGGLFILCAGLGFIPAPSGAVQVFLRTAALAFFLPPALLLYQAGKQEDRETMKLIRNLSALSLALTLVLLVGNILCAAAPEILGTILYYTLVIVTSPMICSGHWAMSMFLWACLLMGSLRLLRRN